VPIIPAKQEAKIVWSADVREGSEQGLWRSMEEQRRPQWAASPLHERGWMEMKEQDSIQRAGTAHCLQKRRRFISGSCYQGCRLPLLSPKLYLQGCPRKGTR
jgi:hypothetical protein